MIKIRQMLGRGSNGQRVAFEIDAVFLREGERDPILIGFAQRKEGAVFAPRIPLPDDTKAEAIEALDEHRASIGIGPIAGLGCKPPDPAAADLWESEEDAEDE